jgi:hypothetical protein
MIRSLPLTILTLAAGLAACTGSSPATPGAAGPDGKGDRVGSEPDPDDFESSMHCWDQSFAYNTLGVTERGDELDIELSGASVEIAEFAPNEDGWHPARVAFTIPEADCVRSDSDRRLLACSSPDVVIELAVNFGEPATAALSFVSFETTFVTRTHASGNTATSVDLDVLTLTDEHHGQYSVSFPVYLEGEDPCQTQTTSSP